MQSSNVGQELLDRVFRHLNLLETAYFGLRYLDHETQTVKNDDYLVELEDGEFVEMIDKSESAKQMELLKFARKLMIVCS